jgi:hypothetical protein
MKPRHSKPSREELGLPPKPSIFNLFKKDAKGHLPSHNHSHGHNHSHRSEPENIAIYTIAVVLDGQVYEVLRAQETMADLLLSQPTFVLVTDETSIAKINYKYVDGKFIENEPTT